MSHLIQPVHPAPVLDAERDMAGSDEPGCWQTVSVPEASKTCLALSKNSKTSPSNAILAFPFQHGVSLMRNVQCPRRGHDRHPGSRSLDRQGGRQ